MTIADNIARLREALAAGPTPGPWATWGKANPSQVIAAPSRFVAQTLAGDDEANASYIAAADPDTIAALLAAWDEREAMRKLAAFGAWAAREFRDSLSDVDGGSAQDAMERFGVIVKSVVTEPCGDGCVCAEYGDFPHECYKFPPEISAVMQEHQTLAARKETP